MYEIVSPDVLSLDVFLLLFFLKSIKIFNLTYIYFYTSLLPNNSSCIVMQRQTLTVHNKGEETSEELVQY